MFRQNQDTRPETLWMSSWRIFFSAGIHFVISKGSRRRRTGQKSIYRNNEATLDWIVKVLWSKNLVMSMIFGCHDFWMSFAIQVLQAHVVV